LRLVRTRHTSATDDARCHLHHTAFDLLHLGAFDLLHVTGLRTVDCARHAVRSASVDIRFHGSRVWFACTDSRSTGTGVWLARAQQQFVWPHIRYAGAQWRQPGCAG
jgi:hypothetical protein